jgi:hypothetical protein
MPLFRTLPVIVAAILFNKTRRAQDWVGAHPSNVELASVA